MSASLIRFENVSKAFGSTVVIDDLNLDVRKGEFLTLLGPSGSGKTTTLLMLAGFEAPSGGTILVDGKRIDDLPAHRRGMGVVFQNYALFPHLTVAQNVAFPLQMRGVPRGEIARRVDAALDRVQLRHLSSRKPSQLSGGQQQRVALTRCLVFEPKVILMDEPLSALDKQLRERLQLEIRELYRREGLTVVFVTHDQSEALTMSDRIAVFNRGAIAQIGTPADIYDRPANRFVSEFIGETNLLEAEVTGRGDDHLDLALEGGPGIRVPGRCEDRAVAVSIRPERLVLDAPELDNHLDATVDDVVYQGNHLRIHLSCGPLRLVAQSERRIEPPVVGRKVRVSFAAEDCTVLTE
ncbi:putative spermidine/putrescine transport system ATP-binding protein [Palleronia aestuarii]|uniref:Spermidine/putrescine import ATP-binding protein PotA n=1 Tax=Palleronia aestuarii TaxID=568105 RepID=A0A2W7Q479_9RHOB|nr:ABC transporter ATP-binding protein [Palleronia aestuarii]PZX16479.1 putative spermidine/putrescine transport system ATP-binding protein [Palleronia aestuarii]